jgi:hypothetical protein
LIHDTGQPKFFPAAAAGKNISVKTGLAALFFNGGG